MSKNSLYNFINSLSATSTLSSQFHHTHSKGKKYFLFELPVKNKIIIAPYTLTNHHLSVYEGPLGKLDYKSEYHYTAFFHDEAGREYRLHVYYNASDELVCAPLLSVKVADNVFEPVACSENYEAFRILANQSIHELISDLRKKQNECLGKLQAEYDVLDKKTSITSQDIAKKKIEYLALLESLIGKLRELAKYSSKRTHIESKIIFLENLKKAVQNIKEEITLPPEQFNSPSQKSSKGKAQPKGKASLSANLSVSKEKSTKKKIKFADVLADLTTEMKHIEGIKDAHLSDKIIAFFAKVVESECALESEKYSVTVEDLQHLQQFKKHIESFIKNTLQRLLLSENYKEADELRAFAHLVPETMMQLALMQNRSGLINFLLSNGVISPNYGGFKIREVQYRSLIDYYLKQTDVTPEMLNCFEVLIANNLSLMDLDDSGLPVAAVLLLQPKHPLHQVLIRNAERTLDNFSFYQHLNQILWGIIGKSDCSEERKIQLKELIKCNQEKMNLLKPACSIGKMSLGQLAADIFNYAKKTIGEDLLEQIRIDPEISVLVAKIKKYQAAILSRLSQTEKYRFLNSVKEQNVMLKKACDSIDACTDVDLIPLFSDFKEYSLGHYCKILEYYQSVQELLDVQDKIKGFNALNGRGKKQELKRLFEQQNQLMQEINVLERTTMSLTNKSVQSLIDDGELRKKVDSINSMLHDPSHKTDDLMQALKQLLAQKSDGANNISFRFKNNVGTTLFAPNNTSTASTAAAAAAVATSTTITDALDKAPTVLLNGEPTILLDGGENECKMQ